MGVPPGNGCNENQGIQDWFNLPVFVEYSQISKPTVKSNSYFVGVNIPILIFIKSVENISRLLDLERGQHSNKLKLQGIRTTLKTRPDTYSHITAPKKKIARAFHVLARPPNFPLSFPQGIGNLRSRASVSLLCVERHSGTVFGDEFWPTFPRNFVLANKKQPRDIPIVQFDTKPAQSPTQPRNGPFATLKTRRKLGRVSFRKDFWDCY